MDVHIEPCDEPLDTASPSALERTLQHILGTFKCKNTQNLIYDVSRCTNVDPGAVLLFCYAFELSKQANREMKIQGQAGDLINELIAHFQNYHGKNSDDPFTANFEGLYRLRRISDESSMLRELQEWTNTVQRGTNASEEQVALWQMQIAEVTTNAFQHGPMHKKDGVSSLVAGKALGDFVQLAVLDFGSTIPRVIGDVAKSHGIPNDDGELIRFACKKSITSQSVRQNQGAGLYSLVQTVYESKGILQILSRNGLAQFCNHKEICRVLSPWPDGTPAMDGTLTIVNLRI